MKDIITLRMYCRQCQWILFVKVILLHMSKVTILTETRILPLTRYVSSTRGKIEGSKTTPRKVYFRCRPILLLMMILKESTSTLWKYYPCDHDFVLKRLKKLTKTRMLPSARYVSSTRGKMMAKPTATPTWEQKLLVFPNCERVWYLSLNKKIIVNRPGVQVSHSFTVFQSISVKTQEKIILTMYIWCIARWDGMLGVASQTVWWS